MQLGWNLIGFMENLRIVLTQDNGLPERLRPRQSHSIQTTAFIVVTTSPGLRRGPRGGASVPPSVIS